MKGHVGSFLAGVGLAAVGAFVIDKVRSGEIDTGEIGDRIKQMSDDVVREVGDMKGTVVKMASVAMVDLNEGSREDLQRLGIPEALLDRVIEARPYRNKMDLLTRMVVPDDVYNLIKEHVCLHGSDEGVKVA